MTAEDDKSMPIITAAEKTPDSLTPFFIHVFLFGLSLFMIKNYIIAVDKI